MKHTTRIDPQRAIAYAVLAGCSAMAFASSTDITDTPLPVTSSVAPNIVLTIDTSGSMSNIVPDSPYDASTTYLNCPAANVLAGGVASPAFPNSADTLDVIVNADGTVKMVVSGAGNGDYTFGTGSGQKCFDPVLRYNARLNADTYSNNGGNCTAGFTPCNYPGSGYLDAVYTGNYLNWYFGDSANSYTAAANFGANATRKSGTSNRMEIARTASKNIVDALDKVRVGLVRYNSVTSGGGGELVTAIADLTSGQKTTVKTAIDGLAPSGNTPLAETLSGIGAYLAKTPSGTAQNLVLHKGQASQTSVSSSSVFSGDGDSLRNSSSATAPVQYWCQKSFAVLLTDGRPQGDQSISSSLCDYMGVIGSCPTSGSNAYGKKGAANGTGADAGYHVNGSFKQLHLGGTHDYESAGSDYLDDVAAALYDIDLRPDLTKPTGSTSKNNVMTYTIGFADEQAINDPLLQEAAAAGGGLFLTATNSAQLVTAFERATDDILAKDGSAAAVAVANAHVTNTDNASYATSYNSGTWTGDLIAYPIDTETGVPNKNSPIWDTGCANPTAYVDPTDTSKGVLGCSAQVLLDLKTSGTRKIFTSNDTATCYFNCGIPFQPTTAAGTSGADKLSAAQQTRLNTPSTTDGAGVVSYLRGDRTGENSGTYRARAHLLGDTVDAEPAVVRAPEHNYADPGYSTYKSTNDNRTRLIIQAANDGMVHAFNSTTGAEEWAYVPDILISSTKNNDPNNSSTAILNTRTRKTGFNHYFLIDATPTVGDVDFDKANSAAGTGTPDWRTIVVGGLGKGGRGYYALDVTTATANTEAAAAGKALWEFPRSISNSTNRTNAQNNLGYTFGKPVIVKTRAAGWVVLVTSGYNNGTNSGDSGGDGYGHLYVLNPKTGDLIKDIVTPQCRIDATTTASAANSQANPCGLTHINAYVEDRETDNTATYAYGGDLYGNVWRFDFTGDTTASWSVSKLAKLRSGNTATSAAQPITSVPELSKVTISGTNYYFVYVGTGQYLGKTDLPCPPSGTCAWTPNAASTQTQTMYGLIDPRDGTTLPDPLLDNLLQQTYTTSGNSRTFTTTAMTFSGGGAKKGWYVNFTGGERIVTDPAIAAGALIFTSNIPDTTACQPGGSSWLYTLDYEDGGQTSTTDGSWGGTKLASALASRPVLIQLPDGTVKALTRLSDATTITTTVPVAATATAGKRVSWRELIDQ